MACNRCGIRCKGGLCPDCELERLYGDDVTVDQSDNEETAKHYECTVCGDDYYGSGHCPKPDCNSHRRRYIGDLGASA